MAGSLGCNCPTNDLTFRLLKSDGTFVYLEEDIDGVVTLDLTEDLQNETTFAGIEGPGIEITAGGTAGHTPTIGLCVDPDSPIPLEFVTVGGQSCLTASRPSDLDPEWGPSGNTLTQGIRIVPGGIRRHNPTITLALGDDQFGFNADGELIFNFDCDQLNTCSIGDLADVNLDAAVNDAHILMYDAATSRFQNWFFNEALALIFGIPAEFIPAVPLVGGPYRLTFTPGVGPNGGRFTWEV